MAAAAAFRGVGGVGGGRTACRRHRSAAAAAAAAFIPPHRAWQAQATAAAPRPARPSAAPRRRRPPSSLAATLGGGDAGGAGAPVLADSPADGPDHGAITQGGGGGGGLMGLPHARAAGDLERHWASAILPRCRALLAVVNSAVASGAEEAGGAGGGDAAAAAREGDGGGGAPPLWGRRLLWALDELLLQVQEAAAPAEHLGAAHASAAWRRDGMRTLAAARAFEASVADSEPLFEALAYLEARLVGAAAAEADRRQEAAEAVGVEAPPLGRRVVNELRASPFWPDAAAAAGVVGRDAAAAPEAGGGPAAAAWWLRLCTALRRRVQAQGCHLPDAAAYSVAIPRDERRSLLRDCHAREGAALARLRSALADDGDACPSVELPDAQAEGGGGGGSGSSEARLRAAWAAQGSPPGGLRLDAATAEALLAGLPDADVRQQARGGRGAERAGGASGALSSPRRRR